jgi:hypothetical protein
VQNVKEAVLDAELQQIISKYGAEQHQKLQLGFTNYTVSGLIAKLRAKYLPNEATQAVIHDNEMTVEGNEFIMKSY